LFVLDPKGRLKLLITIVVRCKLSILASDSLSFIGDSLHHIGKGS